MGYKVLVSKIYDFALGLHFCNWITNFLVDRKSKANLDGISSDYFYQAGVPQGSVLSPIMFIIYLSML